MLLAKFGGNCIIMNSLRAQDILKHITGDEDYGVAMMQKLPLDEAIAVEGDLLNACIKEADEKKNANDAAFSGICRKHSDL
ncbi:hypothetical protein BACPEC_02148 [[Bacteroides] pectinophilus ATCC 43243]|uniref:Uncharacterized protein n=1 Tax=[Bacteroides] pectinophilus ATCC 43243 TaxID=483218 RepID=B7ASU0_9FIRM|nr:hypothetical protein BACPEC_02148 [[Bacteroides] pectinophilus ATCC 43243]